MDSTLFLTVIAAAALHAGWNALVRIGLDRLLSMTLIQMSSGAIALLGLFFVAPPAKDAWPWIALSALLHIGYNVFLARAYQSGDLGQVYPIARGTAPLLVMLIGLLVLNERPSLLGYLGVTVLSVGIWLMAVHGGRGLVRLERQSVSAALITSFFIAGYTLADGHGARVNGDPLAYILWLFTVNGMVMTVMLLAMRGAGDFSVLLKHWRGGLAGGAMSLAAYGITIWAMSLAPIALVAALRESSVLFALIISALWLHEPLGRGRLVAGSVILVGVVMTRLS